MIEFGGPGWRRFWRDEPNGDDVHLNEQEGLVAIDLSQSCGWHRKGTFCSRCFPRALAAVEAARRAIDPEAPAQVRADPEAGDWPRLVALHNPADKRNLVLRFVEARRVSAAKTILSGRSQERPVGALAAGRHATESPIADAALIRDFGIAFRGAPAPDYARRFLDVKVSFFMDGEAIVDRALFADFSDGPLPLKKSKRCALFEALSVDEDGRVADSEDPWIGYFAPRQTVFEVRLDGVPGGGGLVEVESSWSLAEYTSRKG